LDIDPTSVPLVIEMNIWFGYMQSTQDGCHYVCLQANVEETASEIMPLASVVFFVD